MFYYVMIGNLFALSVQLNLISTSKENEHDHNIFFLIKRIPATMSREVN